VAAISASSCGRRPRPWRAGASARQPTAAAPFSSRPARQRRRGLSPHVPSIRVLQGW
jgi:hypothetical protein